MLKDFTNNPVADFDICKYEREIEALHILYFTEGKFQEITTNGLQLETVDFPSLSCSVVFFLKSSDNGFLYTSDSSKKQTPNVF